MTPKLCELCGGKVIERHCKIVCTACGFTRDCSDPVTLAARIARPFWIFTAWVYRRGPSPEQKRITELEAEVKRLRRAIQREPGAIVPLPTALRGLRTGALMGLTWTFAWAIIVWIWVV